MPPSSNCVSTFPETSRFAKTVWLLGCVLQGIGYGILLLLAFTCFQALRKRKGGSLRINRGLIVYTLLSAALGTVTEITDITLTIRAVLDDTCVGPYLHPPHPYLGPSDIVSFMITLLTDGLLVWRCYAITTNLKGGRWFALLWLTPLFLYIVTLGTSIGLVIGTNSPPQKQGFLPTLFPIYLGTSAFLNALITIIIVCLLFRHRRMMIQAFGHEQQVPLLNIIVILVESAALIVIVDIVVIVSIVSLRSVGEMVSQIWNVVQPIASLLIIERVARNSDYFNQSAERFGPEVSNPSSTLLIPFSAPQTDSRLSTVETV